MALVKVRVFEAERFYRIRTAMLTTATLADRAQISGVWHDLNSTPLGEPVESVTIIGRHTFSMGDRLEVGAPLDGAIIAQANILAIRLVRADDLNKVELAALGYSDRESFELGWGALVTGARAWWFDIERLDTPQTVQWL